MRSIKPHVVIEYLCNISSGSCKSKFGKLIIIILNIMSLTRWSEYKVKNEQCKHTRLRIPRAWISVLNKTTILYESSLVQVQSYIWSTVTSNTTVSITHPVRMPFVLVACTTYSIFVTYCFNGLTAIVGEHNIYNDYSNLTWVIE